MSKPTRQSRGDLAARRERAAAEGRKALAEYEAHDVALRKNMAKLRALRLAREAAEAEVAKTPSRSASSTASGRGAKTGK